MFALDQAKTNSWQGFAKQEDSLIRSNIGRQFLKPIPEIGIQLA